MPALARLRLLLAVAVARANAPLEVYLALPDLRIRTLGLVFGHLTALTMARAGVASALMGLLLCLMGAVEGRLVTLAAPGRRSLRAAVLACRALAALSCSIAGPPARRGGWEKARPQAPG
ncbi:MAG: hypothetical protein ABWY08_13460, partial [Comamonas sp.]